ncbi:hypothetical protein B0H16DRAFT_1591739, partial [Mycena metata]
MIPWFTNLQHTWPTDTFSGFNPQSLLGVFIGSSVLCAIVHSFTAKSRLRLDYLSQAFVLHTIIKAPLVTERFGVEIAEVCGTADSVAFFWWWSGLLVYYWRKLREPEPPRPLFIIPSLGIPHVLCFAFLADVAYIHPSLLFDGPLSALPPKLMRNHPYRPAHEAVVRYSAQIALPRCIQALFRPFIRSCFGVQELPEWVPHPEIHPIHLICELLLLSLACWPDVAPLIRSFQRLDILCNTINRAVLAPADQAAALRRKRACILVSCVAWLYVAAPVETY